MNWTPETTAKIERIFGQEYPIEAIEAVATSIVDERVVRAKELEDPGPPFGTDDRDRIEWMASMVAEDYCEPPRNIMLPSIIDAALILADDEVFVADFKAWDEAMEEAFRNPGTPSDDPRVTFWSTVACVAGSSDDMENG